MTWCVDSRTSCTLNFVPTLHVVTSQLNTLKHPLWQNIPSSIKQDQVWVCDWESVVFVVLLTPGDLVLVLAKHVTTARRKTISRVFGERECMILEGEQCVP